MRPMNPHLTLWCRDFSTVPPIERRLARLVLNSISLMKRDELSLPCFNDRDTVSLLWELIQPLLDVQAMAKWRATLYDDLDELTNLSDKTSASKPAASPKISAREALSDFFLTLPPWVSVRLAEIDTEPALMPTSVLLGEALELDTASLRVLDLLELCEQFDPLRRLLRHTRDSMPRRNLERLSHLLAVEFGPLRAALTRRAPLRMLGLIELTGYESDLESFCKPSSLLRHLRCRVLRTFEDQHGIGARRCRDSK